jgi:two-component system sensor histidine kinase CiaH
MINKLRSRFIRIATLSVAAVLLLVVLLSRRAIDPVVRGAEQQKQFITDAGHELKTPITVIATSLKVLELEVGPQKWIDKARAQTEKLRALVDSLVTLSRMDEERSPLRMEPFPVSDAVAETAESFRQVAQDGGRAPGAPVSLSLEKSRGGVTLRVSNACENAGDIDTARLFDRFYRADPSRTSGGFGIGLSIARGIVQGHHGAISAAAEKGVITFTAQLK